MQFSNTSKQPSSTKRGPGRYHVNGHKKASAPKAHGMGDGPDFVVHTNTKKNERRAAIKACGGIRQFKLKRRALREMQGAAA